MAFAIGGTTISFADMRGIRNVMRNAADAPVIPEVGWAFEIRQTPEFHAPKKS
jgi:hypothetical protein